MSTEKLPHEAEEFLRRLRLGLGTLPPDEVDDIVAEVRSHLKDRLESGNTPLLQGFEDVETYASRFLFETQLRGALKRGTSIDLARVLLAGANSGFRTIFAVASLIALEFSGVALVVAGAIKPFMASRVGLFIDSEGRFVALGAYGGDVHLLREVLGIWASPVFLVGGAGLLWIGKRTLKLLATRSLAGVRATRAA